MIFNLEAVVTLRNYSVHSTFSFFPYNVPSMGAQRGGSYLPAVVDQVPGSPFC